MNLSNAGPVAATSKSEFETRFKIARNLRAALKLREDTLSALRLAKKIPVAAASWLPASATHAQVSMTDPQGSGPIVSAVQWLQGTLLGTVATVIAVIAVACVGLLMLSGRINWRHGAVVILGCFILFGAASIVAGIRSSAAFVG